MPARTPADFDIKYYSKLILLWENIDGGGVPIMTTLIGPPGAVLAFGANGSYIVTFPPFYSTANVVSYAAIATRWCNVSNQDYHTAVTAGPFSGLPIVGVDTSGPSGAGANLWGQPNFRMQLKFMFKFRDYFTY